MDSEGGIIVTTFMYLFNAAHAFTVLQMEIMLMVRSYYNNNK